MANSAENFIREIILPELRQSSNLESIPQFRQHMINFIMDNRKEWSSEPQLKPIDLLKQNWTIGEIMSKLDELTRGFNQLIKERVW